MKKNKLPSNCVVLAQCEPIRHYRIPIYNRLEKELKSLGLHLTVIGKEIDSYGLNKIKFDLEMVKGDSRKFLKTIWEKNPKAVIAFMSLNAPVVWPLILLGRMKNVAVINWRHAIDLSNTKSVVKNILYRLMTRLADRTILYSEDERKYLPLKQQRKIYIANNTIDFSDTPSVKTKKEDLKKSVRMPFEKIVLFSGRIQPRKQLDHLVNMFELESFTHYGLIIIGPGISEELTSRIERNENIKYIGPLYDPEQKAKFFTISDVFCIPGAVGLGINEAFYWGLPILTERNHCHGPEIYYLRNGINGYVAENEADLVEKMAMLLSDENLMNDMSINARKTYNEQASPELMISGFINALASLRVVSLESSGAIS